MKFNAKKILKFTVKTLLVVLGIGIVMVLCWYIMGG